MPHAAAGRFERTRSKMHSQAGELATKLDRLYNRIDKIYHRLALPSGVSDCAYWIVYALAEEEGPLAQRDLVAMWSYSKQTVNSALRSLESKGLVTVALEAGSRRTKAVSLTTEGARFAERHVAPMMRVEEKAFDALDAKERTQLVELLGRYADALDAEAGLVLGEPRTPD